MDVYECVYTWNENMSEVQTLKRIVCFVFNFDVGFAPFNAVTNGVEQEAYSWAGTPT